MVQGVFEDGSFLLAGILGESLQASEGYRRMVRGTAHMGPEGETLNHLPLFPDREEILSRQSHAGGHSSIMVMAPIFGKETVFAVHGARFAVGDQTSREIRIYSQTGEVSSIGAWEGPDPTVTDALIAEHQAYDLARASGPEARRLMEQRFRDEIYPDSLPAHGHILFDPHGNLWVEDYQIPEQGTVPWRVFGGKGSQLDTVLMPEGFEALAIGDDYVLGLWWDELDVEYVRLYSMVNREG